MQRADVGGERRATRRELVPGRDAHGDAVVSAPRDAELAAHAEFRKQLYSYDVVPHATAAAMALA